MQITVDTPFATTCQSGGTNVLLYPHPLLVANDSVSNMLTIMAKGGLVGIGTSTPFSQLSVSTLTQQSGSLPLFTVASTTGSTLLTALGTGNIGVGTTSPWSTLSVNGTVAISGLTSGNTGNFLCLTTTGQVTSGASTCTGSSERIKNSIAPLPASSGLADVLGLQPVSFKYDQGFGDNGSTTQLGFIAEDTAAVDPLLAVYATTPIQTPSGVIKVGDPAGINWNGITAASVLAIQQLDARTRFIGNSASSTSFTVDASGNTGIKAPVNASRALTVGGDAGIQGTAYANAFVAPAPTQSFSFGTTTISAALPSEALSPDGARVDLAKLATFAVASTQALSQRVDAVSLRMDSLEARIQKLEDGSITVASGSPLDFSTSTVADALKSFGILVKENIAQFDTLVARQFVAAKDSNGDSVAGSDAVLAGNTVAEIKNPYAHPTSKIVITPTASVDGSWYLSEKDEGSFRVTLSKAQDHDVTFDYFIIETDGQLATPSAASTTPSSDSSEGGVIHTTSVIIVGDTPEDTASTTEPDASSPDTGASSTTENAPSGDGTEPGGSVAATPPDSGSGSGSAEDGSDTGPAPDTATSSPQ